MKVKNLFVGKKFICVLKNLSQIFFLRKEGGFVFVQCVAPSKKSSMQMVQE